MQLTMFYLKQFANECKNIFAFMDYREKKLNIMFYNVQFKILFYNVIFISHSNADVI